MRSTYSELLRIKTAYDDGIMAQNLAEASTQNTANQFTNNQLEFGTLNANKLVFAIRSLHIIVKNNGFCHNLITLGFWRNSKNNPGLRFTIGSHELNESLRPNKQRMEHLI